MHVYEKQNKVTEVEKVSILQIIFLIKILNKIQLPFLVVAWSWGLCWHIFPPASVNLAAFLPLASHGNELCSLTMHYMNNTRICMQGRVICLWRQDHCRTWGPYVVTLRMRKWPYIINFRYIFLHCLSLFCSACGWARCLRAWCASRAMFVMAGEPQLHRLTRQTTVSRSLEDKWKKWSWDDEGNESRGHWALRTPLFLSLSVFQCIPFQSCSEDSNHKQSPKI